MELKPSANEMNNLKESIDPSRAASPLDAIRVSFRGAGHSPPLLDVCHPLKFYYIYIYILYCTVRSACPPGMRKQLFFPPLSKILNAALAISKLESYQNIHYLLSVLAVMPLPTCDAERSISCLGIVKTYAYEKQ